jgi:mRNA-degrading endonuclease RelE of RelBE toxin-antitoxin system
VTTGHFDRLLKKLAPKHPDLVERFEEAMGILSPDPLNRTHNHPIKKLQGVAAGEGQYRLRSGRFRFRYDVAGARGGFAVLRAAAGGYLLIA